LKACLDGIDWPTGTFNGAIAPSLTLPARQVDLGNGLVSLSGPTRKTNGNINDNFQGNVTTYMARYLKKHLHITKFKNTNIYGDYNQYGGKNVSCQTPNFTNVGLVGNYNVGGVADIQTDIRGVLDIKGLINTGQKGGYLELIGDNNDNVGNANFGYSNFSVVDVTGVTTNIDKIGKANYSGDNADMIIFASRTKTNSISGSSSNSNFDAIPILRAFEDASKTGKYAPDTFSANFKSTGGSGTLGSGTNVLALSESDWENASSGTPSKTTWSSAPKWTSENNDLVALSPFRSGAYLAGGMPA
jgi:hypothetical protein